MHSISYIFVALCAFVIALASPTGNSIPLEKPFNATATLAHIVANVKAQTCVDCQDLLLWLQAVARRGTDEFIRIWQEACLEIGV